MMRSSIGLLAKAKASAKATPRGPARLPLNFGDAPVSNFTLLNKRTVPDLNLTAYEFQHDLTKARYVHLDTDDTNNSFCIAFATPAQNHEGTTHVLEHTALCGSKKYPVRDPFFHMLRRSFSNFMNAMTGADYTMYPFSTTNEKDYANLLSVYMDAVLNPLLRDIDFHQEGHRIEVDDSGNVTFNGVVFNEMKGVMSDPQYNYIHDLQKALLPATHYQNMSGGYPPHILNLTHEKLVAFHKRHYHPSNCIVLTYGDLPPTTHMAFIDECFKKFELGTPVPVKKLDDSNRFTEAKAVDVTGPVNTMGELTSQTRTAVCYALENTDSVKEITELQLLSELLTHGPNAPMYDALITSQMGSGYSPGTGIMFHTSTPMATFGVQGMDESKHSVADVESAVMKVLEETAKTGFPQDRVQSVVFQDELSRRHRSTSFGLHMCIGVASTALVTGTDAIELIDSLPYVRNVQQDPSVITAHAKALLENPHKLKFSSRPDPAFLDKQDQDVNERAKELTASLTKAQKKDAIKKNKKWLEKVRAHQNPDILPTLSVKDDVSKKGFREPDPIICGTDFEVIPASTNGLVYANFMLELPECDPTIMPILANLLGKTGAGNMDYKEISLQSELCSSGFGFGLNLNNVYGTVDEYIRCLTVGFYTTVEKLDRALSLLKTILTDPHVAKSDPMVTERVMSILKARAASKINKLAYNGHTYATTRAVSICGGVGELEEQMGGITHINAMKEMLSALQGGQDSAQKCVEGVLEKHATFTQGILSTAGRCGVWCVAEPSAAQAVTAAITSFRSDLPSATSGKSLMSAVDAKLPFKAVTEGSTEVIKLPLQTSFSGSVMTHGLAFGTREHAVLKVACQLLKNEFLHQKIREEGGAYGSGASASMQGNPGGICMSSYRDPTPENTRKVMASCHEWLATKKNVKTRTVEEAKLRLFANVDAPVCPSSYGEDRWMHRITEQQRQQSREHLFSVTASDVQKIAPEFFKKPSHFVSLVPDAAQEQEVPPPA